MYKIYFPMKMNIKNIGNMIMTAYKLPYKYDLNILKYATYYS